MRLIFLVFMVVIMSSCAVLHHAHVGDIDNRTPEKQQQFEVMVSETGISLDDVKTIAGSTKGKKNQLGKAAEILALFQMGPSTGNPVYVEDYANDLKTLLLRQCPDGKIVNLMSIRESNKYPVVSGEIVKIIGACIHSN